MNLKRILKEFDSKDQSLFYGMVIMIFGWLFLSIGLNSRWMKLVGAGFCFGYLASKLVGKSDVSSKGEGK